jgi:dGTPase
MAGECTRVLIDEYGTDLELSRFIGELVRALIGGLIDDLIAETTRRVELAAPVSAAAVRTHGAPLAAFSTGMQRQLGELKSFLFTRMYRHPRVMGSMEKAKAVIGALFEAFSSDPARLPADWARLCGGPNDPVTMGVVRDYIAGMTDRFALTEYRRVFNAEISL